MRHDAFGARSAEQSDEPGQLVFREDLLDQRKQLALLTAHVSAQLLTQRMERVEAGAVARHIMGQPPDADVIDQDAGEDRLFGVAESRVGGQQDVLLLAEVALPVGPPIREERVAYLGGGGLAGRLRRWATTRAW